MIKPYRLSFFLALINFFLFGQDFFVSKEQEEIANNNKPRLTENNSINKLESLKDTHKQKIHNNDSLELETINKDKSFNWEIKKKI